MHLQPRDEPREAEDVVRGPICGAKRTHGKREGASIDVSRWGTCSASDGEAVGARRAAESFGAAGWASECAAASGGARDPSGPCEWKRDARSTGSVESSEALNHLGCAGPLFSRGLRALPRTDRGVTFASASCARRSCSSLRRPGGRRSV